MIGIMGFFVFSYIFVMHSSGRREMHLCNTLIKQMEATQQAERKSMNKSLAFATASHDIQEVSPGSELETNLRQMETCARDLFGILNSILDTNVVDLYHPVGLKKGIDVVLDPHDGSLIKFPCAVGDRGRLKQILCNLVSNAVKFTSEGHVTVRAWVEKPSFKNSIAASGKGNGVARQLLYLFNHSNKAQADMGTMKHDPNALEFVFEVDDTGKGIPKEKQKSVFENYVQVKETALGEGGTGLGLGIVQSLVRLMHGEIGIVDKEMGERGTCFRFSVLLTLLTHTPSTPGLSIHTPSPRLNIRTPCSTPKVDGSGSSVVLLIKNEERRRISQKFMENLGIKTSLRGATGFVLVVVDATAGPFSELCKIDVIKHKALHGSRLYEVVRLLPEFGAQINLTRLGATVELCGNGREALDLVRGALANQGKHGFDYILMDCEMPEMDGFEATRQIRREEKPYNLHIPIIALTGHASGEERSRRMEAGMDDHLSKPFQREQLLEKTRRIDRNKLKEKC
ncbi:histidine kinase CKI1-like [Pyrus ussuriensis x Pyrus communis]|uniref:histidine kinase n=1 Tax=Pyrus ussuriensis x Pyrus communis TaxID=2448454 RepID=A0A5N5G3D5_9ROSA|nr:histidine kinase CKI1-like [Pyrus ussuriensis x Pyrus communis]